tara:strand:+ start:953 stop:1123 length:171 start_codon:yes stop_codon:yes gene_type:complete
VDGNEATGPRLNDLPEREGDYQDHHYLDHGIAADCSIASTAQGDEEWHADENPENA